MGRFKRKKKSEYFQRQTYIMSNLGLFYIIIIALFGVPLMGTFVVVLIKGVFDLRFIIVPAATLFLGLMLFFGLRGLRRWVRRVRQDGRQAMDAAQKQSRHGQAVQVSIFNGMLSLTLGAPNEASGLPPGRVSKELPPPPHDASGSEPDVLMQLKELVALRKEGEIDDQEFEVLKAQLIESFGRLKDKN